MKTKQCNLQPVMKTLVRKIKNNLKGIEIALKICYLFVNN